jgi:hypothetical protein
LTSRDAGVAVVSDVVRLGYGVALLVAPGATGRSMTGAPLDPRATLAARVLGVRHVVQALACLTHGTPLVRRMGQATDLLHAASMGALAAYDPARRRQALTDGTVALAFAAAGQVG